MVCEAWALQGYGTPLGVYAVYALKVALYVGGVGLLLQLHPRRWASVTGDRLLVARTRSRSRRPSSGACSSRGSAWAAAAARSPAATSRRSAASSTSCARAPPSCRSFPGSRCSAARGGPGSTSRSTWPCSARCCGRWSRPRPTPAVLLPIAVLVPLLGIADRTIFLAAARRALLDDDRLLRLRQQLDRRRQGGAARALVLGRLLQAQPPLPDGGVRDDQQQPGAALRLAAPADVPRTTRTTCDPRALAEWMAHAGHGARAGRADRPRCSRPAGPSLGGRDGADADAARLHHQQRAHGRAHRVERAWWSTARFALFWAHPDVTAGGDRAARARRSSWR